jgi:hypothetical protein
LSISLFLGTIGTIGTSKVWANEMIPKPVWAVGFALEQTLHVVALTVFSYVDFKVASA